MAQRPDSFRVAQAAGSALPASAAGVLLLAAVLPVRFEWRPNDLGIVSATTQHRYPVEQEIFWFVFAGAAGCVLAWALGRALASRWTPRLGLGFEAGATAGLLMLLVLPLLLATPLAIGAVLAALAATGAGDASRLEAASAPPEPRSRARRRVWGLVFGILVVLRTTELPASAWLLATGIPDLEMATNHWFFQAEHGQHLAWASFLMRGDLHGRDFFCLYGPLFDWLVVAFWAVFGKSVAAAVLLERLSNAAGLAALLALGAALVRRPVVLLLLPFAVTGYVDLRMGLGLFGLLALRGALGREGAWRWALAGALGGFALLYSQEYGIAFLLVAFAVVALRFEARAALALGGGVVAVTTPLLVAYATAGALAPMLADFSRYPGYVMAGYGNHLFPSLWAALPLATHGLPDAPAFLPGYVGPAVLVGAVVVASGLVGLDPRRPVSSLRRLRAELLADPARLAILATGLFGLVSFRSALGRSDFDHVSAPFAVATLLLGVAIDRSLTLGRLAPALGAWRLLALAAVLAAGGFFHQFVPNSLYAFERTLRSTGQILTGRYQLRSDPRLARVTRWIREHSEPGDPVLFLPNNAAYYYLTERPPPIRFVLSHQIVTDAHRAEALADLRRNPPRFVVWDDRFHRVDGIPDALVLGPEIMAWLDASYELRTRIPPVRILGRRDARDR